MGSPSDTDFSAYSDKERNDIAHREEKNNAIAAYNDEAGELNRPELPPREAVVEVPEEATPETEEETPEEGGSTDEGEQGQTQV